MNCVKGCGLGAVTVLLTVLACATVLTVLAVLTPTARVLATEDITNRHVRMLRYRLSNILAKTKRVVDDTPTTAEDGATDVTARLD